MVVGLGNPGSKFADTRHNVGFNVVDLLAQTLQIDVTKRKFGARLGLWHGLPGGMGLQPVKIRPGCPSRKDTAKMAVPRAVADKKLILLKPWQFMNRSGEAVAGAVAFYKLPLGDLLIVLDDMALEPGRIRIRSRGSAGGHNGLEDIIAKLGTDRFARLRVGIGQSDRLDSVDYVLGEPTPRQRPLLAEAGQRAKDAVLCWINEGIEAAMNKFNRTEMSQ
jgi:PTH1 family peptidyl-tRNA hydrolase